MTDASSACGRLPRSPYPGLRPFEEQESSIFKGRDRQVGEVLRLLERYRFAVVTGASGCGKSSLVRAGVLAALYRGGLKSAGDAWVEVYFRPGKDPLGNLTAALTGKLLPPLAGNGLDADQEARDRSEVGAILDRPNGLAVFREQFESRLSLGPELDTEAARSTEEARALRRDANLLILADQFEEIFNEFNQGFAAAEMLVAQLLDGFGVEGDEAARPEAPRVYVLITMRSEYLGLCAAYRRMPHALNHAAFYVSRLERAELRQAAVEPLQRWQWLVGGREQERLTLDEGLLSQLLGAALRIKDDTDHLPLFQHALGRLWWLAANGDGGAGHDGCIGRVHLARALGRPEAEIDAIPGDELLAQILERHAEEVYEAQALVPDGKRTTEIMLRRLAAKDTTGKVIRRLAPISDIAACSDVSEEVVEALIERLGAPEHELVQTREGTGNARLVDLAHEALIRKWPRLGRWVDDESYLAHSLQGLMRRARQWTEKGAGRENILRDDDLLWARNWLRDVELYRRTPQAMAAWAVRYSASFGDAWAESWGGPAAAVERFYERSDREREEQEKQQRLKIEAEARSEAEVKQAKAEAATAIAERAAQVSRMWLMGLLATAAVALAVLVSGGLWYRASLTEANLEAQRLLLEVADLHSIALANSGLEFGELPETKRTAVVQELAVVQGKIEQLRAQDVSADLGERLSTLERSVDVAARRVLEAMVVPNERPASATSQREAEEVKRCVLQSDPGKDRDIQQVVPLPRPSGASRTARRAYAILTSRHGVPTLEVAYRRTLPRGGGCVIGLDGVTLPVAAVHKVTMDPEGRWLIERPPTAPEGTTTLPRLHRLNWFEVCDPDQKEGACSPAARRWRVEAVPLGKYLGLAETQLPAAPADMPAPKPVTRDGDFAHLIAPPPQGFEVRVQKTHENAFKESGGSELWWGDVLLSSKAQPGYRIAAYARQGATAAFVVSVRGEDARRPSRAGTVCSGAELCQHVIRVVRLPERQDRSKGAETMVGALPITEVGFVGPPVNGIGFGTGSLEGELAIRFADTGRFATVSIGGDWFGRWLCRFGDPDLAPQPVLFSPPFRNYVATKHGGNEQLHKHIRAEIDAACWRQAAPVIADGAERSLREDRPSHILEVEQALLVPGEKHGREYDTESR